MAGIRFRVTHSGDWPRQVQIDVGLMVSKGFNSRSRQRAMAASQPRPANARPIRPRGTVGFGTRMSNHCRTSSSSPMPCMKL
jgi:hypothetical protein